NKPIPLCSLFRSLGRWSATVPFFARGPGARSAAAVGLRPDVADLLVLGQAVEAAQLGETLVAVLPQPLDEPVAEAGRVIVGRAVTLRLLAIQAGIEPD